MRFLSLIMKKGKKIISDNIIPIIISSTIGIISISISYYVAKEQMRDSEKSQLSTRLDNINGEQMNYPFLEDSNFIMSQCKLTNERSDSSLRYTIYCERVFNFIQDLTEYYYYNKKDIEKFVDIDYFINQHKCWILKQEKDPNIHKAYPKKILDFINSYVQ